MLEVKIQRIENEVTITKKNLEKRKKASRGAYRYHFTIPRCTYIVLCNHRY